MIHTSNISQVSAVNRDLAAQLQHRIDRKTKPPGALGRLESLALEIGLIQNSLEPEIRAPAMLVFAADHGASAEGVSPYPKEVTAQMVLNFLNGGAAINVFARQNRLKLVVVDAGVDYDFADELKLPVDQAHRVDQIDDLRLVDAKVARGSANFVGGDALHETQFAECLQRGAQIVRSLAADGTNAVAFGEMGIGNTSAASLLQSILTDRPIAECVGRGTGHDDAGLLRKTEVLGRAHERFHRERAQREQGALWTPAELAQRALQSCGGLEIAMMSGAMIEAAARRMVLVIDGYITSAAALAAIRMAPAVRDYCVFAHVSGERGHRALLETLQADPLLDLGMRLGEGTGAALAFSVISAAVNFLNQMASFEDAGVSDRQASPEDDAAGPGS